MVEALLRVFGPLEPHADVREHTAAATQALRAAAERLAAERAAAAAAAAAMVVEQEGAAELANGVPMAVGAAENPEEIELDIE